MIRFTAALALVALAAPALALDLEALVAKHSAANGVPEALVRRVIKIESRGQPHLVSKGNYGLMQIRYGTAKAMGYTGTPQGLLDADTNMTYAVRYLAGAYRVAGGNADRAVRLYQRGYYDVAKAKGVSPYRLASQTSTPVEKPALRPTKPAKVAAPPNTAIAATEQPATLQERFAAATGAIPGAALVKPVTPRETLAAAPPVKTLALPETVAVMPPVRPAPPAEKLAVAAPVQPVAVLAPAPQMKSSLPRETLAAVPKDRHPPRHRRAKADKPFNLMSYLTSKLSTPEKPVRTYRYRTHRAAKPRRGAPMLSAARPPAHTP